MTQLTKSSRVIPRPPPCRMGSGEPHRYEAIATHVAVIVAPPRDPPFHALPTLGVDVRQKAVVVFCASMMQSYPYQQEANNDSNRDNFAHDSCVMFLNLRLHKWIEASSIFVIGDLYRPL
jgi:hypothetical protein